jgi:N-methylhydantoinase A/oxoprolinase/acetone carboxylase beta subunit
LPREPNLPTVPAAAPIAARAIYLDDSWTEAAVFDFDALASGQRITGPAIVESAMTTVLLRRGDAAVATEQGWLAIDIGSKN